MPKHKHADLIIAWANGAEIQYKDGAVWKDIDPSWINHIEYRIKPKQIYPTTSLTDDECLDVYSIHDGQLQAVANAAIKRYIEDNEK